MIELPRMGGERKPLIAKKPETYVDAKRAGIALLSIVGLAIVALARGNVNFHLSTAVKFTQKSMCGDLDHLGYGAKAKADCIDNLPGLTFQPSFHSFSGYLNVGTDADKRELFYWFVEHEKDPANKPLVFWTNGGPGCSGFDGLLAEHGPYLTYSDLSLRPNEHSLNKLANVVYIEAPYGVGFSKVAQGKTMVVGDTDTARDSAALIREFLRSFPKFKDREVYIASESYGGHYMPTLAKALLDGIDKKLEPLVNFKGLAVGNPFVDFYGNIRGSMNAYFGHSLIKYPLIKAWNDDCETDNPDWDNVCGPLYKQVNKQVGHLDPYALDFTFCPFDALETGGNPVKLNAENNRKKQYMMHAAMHRILQVESKSGYVACADNYMHTYLNKPEVQKAIHAKPTEWELCSDPVHKGWPQSSWETKMQDTYKELADAKKIKILVYSGDDDSVCSTYATQLWMWKLGYKADPQQDWRAWYMNDQLGGYQTRFVRDDGSTALDFTTIHSAGHMVPQTQPRFSFAMFQGFLESDEEKKLSLGEEYAS